MCSDQATFTFLYQQLVLRDCLTINTLKHDLYSCSLTNLSFSSLLTFKRLKTQLLVSLYKLGSVNSSQMKSQVSLTFCDIKYY